MPLKDTDVTEFISSLDAGLVQEQMGKILSEMAHRVLEHGKNGKLVLTMTMAPLGSGHQVKIQHKLDATLPTKTGKKQEDTSQETPMHVNPSGDVTFFPEQQGRFFGMKGEVEKPEHQNQK